MGARNPIYYVAMIIYHMEDDKSGESYSCLQGAEGAPRDTLLIRILLPLHLLDFSSLCIDLESVLLDGELHVEEVMAGHEVEVIDLAEGT